MNQYVLFHFTVTKNDRLYQFAVQPGTPWADVEEVLDEMKASIITLKEDAIKQEAEKKSQAEAEQKNTEN